MHDGYDPPRGHRLLRLRPTPRTVDYAEVSVGRRGRGLHGMAPALPGRCLVVVVAVLACIVTPGSASTEAASQEAPDTTHQSADDCEAVVDSFLATRSKLPTLTPESHNHMLYFLHIPRTAGRTYHACFLKCASQFSFANVIGVPVSSSRDACSAARPPTSQRIALCCAGWPTRRPSDALNHTTCCGWTSACRLVACSPATTTSAWSTTCLRTRRSSPRRAPYPPLPADCWPTQSRTHLRCVRSAPDVRARRCA